jgi:hypothetical protein
VAEPSIAIGTPDGGEIGGAAATGTYANGRMFFGMFAWTVFD